MHTNVALLASFALFTIGSAEVGCQVQGAACTDGSGYIGTCSNNSTCAPDETACNGTDACVRGDLNGTCAGSKCKYTEASCPLKDSSCMDSMGRIGKCSSSTGGKCVLDTKCSGSGLVCSEQDLKGKCATAKGICKYTEASCDVGATVDTPCMDGGYLLGQCKGAVPGTSLQCEIDTDKCSGKATAADCNEGYLKGKCVLGGGKCKYEEASCLKAGVSCRDSGMLIGTCVDTSGTKTCKIGNICLGRSKDASCEGSYLKGLCVQKHGKCKYTEASCTGSMSCMDSGNLIGKCSGADSSAAGQCMVDNKCANLEADADCTEDTSKGKCVEAGGTCKRTDTVKVDYTIEVTENDPQRIGDKIGKDVAIFPSTLDAENPQPQCQAWSGSTKNATLDCSQKDHTFYGSGSCVMACVSGGYTVKTAHTIVCGAGGMWKGNVGACAKQCDPATTANDGASSTVAAANMHGSNDTTNKTVTFLRKVDKGRLVCKDIFHDSGLNYCTLECDNDYRVKTKSEYGCAADRTWKGSTLGVCELSDDVSASVHVVLSVNDDITTEAFKNKFREAVALNLAGVGAHHVEIKAISMVPNSNGRRLEERSVNIDYAVRLAKGDQEGAAELDKLDGRLLVGGVLRGIR